MRKERKAQHPAEGNGQDQDMSSGRNESGSAGNEEASENAEAAENAGDSNETGVGTAEPPAQAAAREAPAMDLEVVPLDQHQRLLAEFDNYRKRLERENARLAQWVTGEIISRLLPVLDDFERAEAACAPGSEGFDKKGVLIIRDRLAEALRKEGLKEVEAAQGVRFDPEFHEAVLAVPSDEIPEGHVTQLLQKGYRLGDRLLRAAKVAVSTGPPDKSGGEAQGD